MTSPISDLLKTSPPDWQAVLDACIAAFAGTTGTLHRLDPADGMLKLLAQRGIPPQLMPMVQTIPVGKGIAGVAAERREPVELCNLQQDLGRRGERGSAADECAGLARGAVPRMATSFGARSAWACRCRTISARTRKRG